MSMRENVISYLAETYAPEGIILYGSFANGTENAHSDFDALVIGGTEKCHDSSVVEGTVLDVFVYPPETFQGDFDPEAFVQVFDGKIVLDRNGTAKRLKAAVLAYLESLPGKTAEEQRQAVEWCRKMLLRTGRGDAEGYFRWHWLLTDSLEIYCDLKTRRYLGPKKTLRLMEQQDPEGFGIYTKALKEFTRPSLAAWVSYLERIMP